MQKPYQREDGFDISIDWLSFTFAVASTVISDEIPAVVEKALSSILPRTQSVDRLFEDAVPCVSDSISVVQLDKGLVGYTNSADIVYDRNGTFVKLGKCAWGGASQKNKVYVSLNSEGSKLVSLDTAKIALGAISARITRLDIALDDFAGLYPVSLALDAYETGLFTTGGVRPNGKLIDDLGNKTGKTLYVGGRNARASGSKSSKASKMLRVYEKGKQLKDKQSPWVRYELELHNDNREIPLDVFDNISSAFLGAYGWLSDTFTSILSTAPRRLRCMKKKTELVVQNFVETFSLQYGKLFSMLEDCGVSLYSFVQVVKRQGKPSRFKDSDRRDLRRSILCSFQTGVAA
jgi:DNA relaxase NicK